MTKFLAGHGDVLGGVVVTDEAHADVVRTLSRTMGPVLGPFESYLTMRGIKTFALRMERQCANACRIATWLQSHPRVARVHYLADPNHPDAAVIRRLLPEGLYGALVPFEIKDATKEDVFRFMDKLKLVVRGTSLGDVHSLLLYPAIASHREIAPKQRQRMGISDGLVRLCAGIEAVEDIIADLDQALTDAATVRRVGLVAAGLNLHQRLVLRARCLRWSADRARNRNTKSAARTRWCTWARSSSRSRIRGEYRPPCTPPAAWPDSRAAASSSAPGRLRKCTDSVRRRGSANGWDGRSRCRPGNN